MGKKKPLPPIFGEDNVSEGAKTLISSLVSDKDSIGKLCNYQGCWYYYNTLQGVLNYQRNFKPQDTDIILASFPKSGTTWLKALMIALLVRSKKKDGSCDDLQAHHPLESNNPHDLVPYLEMELYFKTTTPDLTNLPSSCPRLFSTHMPLHTLQVPLKNSPCKIVYICRNLKDVLVSYWHFRCTNLEKTEAEGSATLESMFDSFCTGVNLFGPFWENVLSYWRGSLVDPNHVLFMRPKPIFTRPMTSVLGLLLAVPRSTSLIQLLVRSCIFNEDLKADPRCQVKRLAMFLGYPFSEEEEDSGYVDKMVELCSLRNLSSLEINKTGQSIGFLNSSLFRKGEVGDSKNHLTPEMDSKINNIVEEKFKGSGLKLLHTLVTFKLSL